MKKPIQIRLSEDEVDTITIALKLALKIAPLKKSEKEIIAALLRRFEGLS